MCVRHGDREPKCVSVAWHVSTYALGTGSAHQSHSLSGSTPGLSLRSGSSALGRDCITTLPQHASSLTDLA